MKKSIIFLTILFVSMGSGLMMSDRIIDEIHIVTTVGYDDYKDGKFRGTVVIPVFSPDKKITDVTYTATSSLIYENRRKLNAEASQPLLSGKLEVALFDVELAKRGIFDYIDNLERDPSVGSRVYLAITEGKTEELLNQSYENISIGLYISDLLKQNIKIGNLPKTNLHVFIHHYFADGIDPVLPLFVQKKDKIDIDSLALFKKDKYVGKISYADDAFIFKMLRENFGRGSFTVNEKNKPYAAIEKVESNREFTVKNPRSAPEITIHVKSRGFIREYKGKKIDDKTMAKISKLMEKQIEREGNKLIKKFQELKIDPVGVGLAVKSKTRKWNYKQWEDLYPNAKIKVKAEVLLTESGVIK